MQLNVSNNASVQIEYPEVKSGLALSGLDFVEPLVGVFCCETGLDVLRWVTAVCFIGRPETSAVRGGSFPWTAGQRS
jgi:hypothetical protein